MVYITIDFSRVLQPIQGKNISVEITVNDGVKVSQKTLSKNSTKLNCDSVLRNLKK